MGRGGGGRGREGRRLWDRRGWCEWAASWNGAGERVAGRGGGGYERAASWMGAGVREAGGWWRRKGVGRMEEEGGLGSAAPWMGGCSMFSVWSGYLFIPRFTAPCVMVFYPASTFPRPVGGYGHSTLNRSNPCLICLSGTLLSLTGHILGRSLPGRSEHLIVQFRPDILWPLLPHDILGRFAIRNGNLFHRRRAPSSRNRRVTVKVPGPPIICSFHYRET